MAVTQTRTISLVSQSIASNNSVIKVYWDTVQSGGSFNNELRTASIVIQANGQTVTTLYCDYKLTANTKVVVCDKSVTVPHDEEGNCVVTAIFWMDTGISAGTINDTKQLTLDSIPRVSTLTASNGTLGTEMTLTINKKSSTFKHRLTFNIGDDYAGYIGGSDTSYTTATSLKWTPQIAYARANTTGVSVVVQLTLRTYTSSGEYIGTEEISITCAIPDSVKPSCSLSVDDATGYDSIYGSYVQGLSKIHFEVTATESYGATINAYDVDTGDFILRSAEGTTAELLTSGSRTVVAKVTDTRGRSGSVSKSLTVIPYVAPSVTSLTVIRCDADGVENGQGKYVRINFSATSTSLNNKNSIRYSLKYKPTTQEGNYTEVQLPDLNDVYTVSNYAYIFPAADSSSFDVSVTAADNHKSTTRSTNASTAFTFMDWHPTGTGIAFGKVSEKERTMEIAMHAEIQGTLARKGNQYCTYVPEGGANTGTMGFDLMARITVTGLYANAPLTFTFARRTAMVPMTVHFCFQNQDTLDPAIGFRTVDGENYGAYLVKKDPSIWDLYVARSSEYDYITLQHWYMPQYLENRVEVTFPGGYMGSVNPDGMNIIQLTPAMPPTLLDQVYPIGSIYMAYSWDNDPNLIFGGYWEPISARILRAANYTDVIGSEGGLYTAGTGVDNRTYVNVGVWRRVM